MEKLNIATKELEIISQLIFKHEEIRMKIKGWVIALVIALVTGFLTNKLNINNTIFIFTSTLILLLFLWIEVIYSVAQFRAIKRSLEIEKCIRENGNYDGPKIGLSISIPSNLWVQIKVLNNIRIYGVYLILYLICIIIYLIKYM